MEAAAYVGHVAGAQDFGDWLSERMEEIGIKQAALSRRSGVSQSLISRYRNAEMVPDPATIKKLADALDSDFDAMMVLAGHALGDEKRAARTYIIRTEDPKVHRLIRVASDVAEGIKPADLEQIERILKTFKKD